MLQQQHTESLLRQEIGGLFLSTLERDIRCRFTRSTLTTCSPFLSAEKLLGAWLRGVVCHYPHRCSLKHLGRSRSRTPTAASSRQRNTAKTDVFSRLHLAEEPDTSDAPGRASDRNRGRCAPPLLLGLQTMLRDDDHS